MNISELLLHKALTDLPENLRERFILWVLDLMNDDFFGQTPIRVILSLALLAEINLLPDATQLENSIVYNYVCSSVLDIELHDLLKSIADLSSRSNLPLSTKNQVKTILSLQDNSGVKYSSLLLPSYPRWIADVAIKGLAVRTILYRDTGNYNIRLKDLINLVSTTVTK